MSSKPTPKESSDHLEQRKTLIALDTAIEALGVHTHEASQLDELNIKRQPMTLNTNSDLKPRFFAPKPNLPQPTDELTHEHPTSRAYHFEKDWSSYALSETKFAYQNELWRSMSICDYNPFKHLYKYDKPDFGVFRTMDVPGEEFPHMKAVIYHGSETEGRRLCRGELLIIALRTSTSMVSKGFAEWYLGDSEGDTL
ncbi:hypothetical protein N7471_009027 [Penicillium samsonianum]|uniref:uncharacterized protein n=1 Tax=Penicillium samsonianum TaxID=1882272 RepID=UPI0025497473|nr:uncharacterized protein N7471_009027 [Penicillium samsonianum]KAJ6127810.1 hypothetical protein N7471_009027 [Penicillium samsonianum]